MGGSVTAGSDDELGLQGRLEEHMLGRALISGLIIAVLASILVINLPPSRLRHDAFPVVEPILDITGLGQSWNLFAPNPRKSTLRLAARMTYADGATFEWHQPESGPFVGPYRVYRWQKFADNLAQGRRPDLWPAMAEWLAKNHRRGGEEPTRVVLVKQVYEAPSPGSDDRDRTPWREEVLFRAEFPSGGSR